MSSKKNRNFKYLLCKTNVLTLNAWFKSLNDKKGKTVLNAFVEIVNESHCIPNKVWVYQRKEVYNKLMKEWSDDNDILMYSIHISGSIQ